MERVDIAIIGTGPAGISAAITAKIRNKSILLFGVSPISEKTRSGEMIRNYPGLPDIKGNELGKAFLNQLSMLGIEYTKDKINMIMPMGSYFAIQGSDINTIYEAESIIVATGITSGKKIPGEDEFSGRGVSFCATCDAGLYKNKDVIVLGYSDDSKEEALFLAENCKKVMYFPMNNEKPEFKESNIFVIDDIPKGITGGMKADTLIAENKSYEADGIFILRDAVAPERFIPGLLTENAHIKVDIDMKTNIDGVFAAGDIAGLPYQYIKSAGQGNTAALSAVSYLAKHKEK